MFIKAPYSNPALEIVPKMANISEIHVQDSYDAGQNAVSFMVGTKEFIIPLGSLVDMHEEEEKLKAEMSRLEEFLKSVNAKLSNEKFVANAPASVVENERKKQKDAQTKLDNIKSTLCKLSKA